MVCLEERKKNRSAPATSIAKERERKGGKTNVKDLNSSRPEHIVLTQAQRKSRLNERDELDLIATEADGPFFEGWPTD